MERRGQESIVEEIVTRLKLALNPEAACLFCSRAREDREDEDACVQSDYDILVVISASDLPGHGRDRIALRALRGLRQPVDVLVLTRDEFDRKRGVVTSLPATVVREGRLLYGPAQE